MRIYWGFLGEQRRHGLDASLSLSLSLILSLSIPLPIRYVTRTATGAAWRCLRVGRHTASNFWFDIILLITFSEFIFSNSMTF